MARANTVIDVMLGEAGGQTPEQRYNDLLHVASVMVNRARMLGVPIESVALNNQFNAYNQRLPAGVEGYRSLAEQALTQVLEQGPVTEATFYATPAAVNNLPGGLAYSAETNSHRYFTDPQMRDIYTNAGYLTPQAPAVENAPTPTFAERWSSAAPMAVETASLDAPEQGLLNPGLSEDRFASGPVAQGLDDLRSGLLSQQPQVSPASAAAAIESIAPSAPTVTAPPSLANAYGQSPRALAEQYASYGAGKAAPMMAGLLSQDVAYQGLINDLSAQKQQLQAGIDPMANTAAWKPAPVEVPKIEVPQQAQPVSYEETASVPGLLSEPAFTPRDWKADKALAQRVQMGLTARKALGAVAGGLLGGVIAGPLGALGGGMLGKSLGAKSYFPPAPKDEGKTAKNGRLTRSDLSDSGRAIYDRSPQARAAIDSGKGGLW